MTKDKIKPSDLIEFANGKKIIVSSINMWVLREYYEDNLRCNTNLEYDIVSISRPYYEKIFERKERER